MISYCISENRVELLVLSSECSSCEKAQNQPKIPSIRSSHWFTCMLLFLLRTSLFYEWIRFLVSIPNCREKFIPPSQLSLSFKLVFFLLKFLRPYPPSQGSWEELPSPPQTLSLSLLSPHLDLFSLLSYSFFNILKTDTISFCFPTKDKPIILLWI